MPIPIRPVNFKETDAPSSFSNIDFSFLLTPSTQATSNKRTVEASNEDAKQLLDVWMNSEKTKSGKYKTKACKLSSSDMARLNSKGFISGDLSSFSFTNKGRMIITTITLGENNAFLKNKKEVNYKEILASMDKRNKNGYRIPKYAASTSNTINLKDNNNGSEK